MNWLSIGPALEKPQGTVFAVGIAKRDGRYYIYIPFMKAPWSQGLADLANIYVIHADSMAGPWSEPVGGAHGVARSDYFAKAAFGTRWSFHGGAPDEARRASFWQEPAPASRRLSLRIVNDCNIVTFYYSADGKTWTRHGIRSEVSGYNANTMDDLSSLRPALYAAGSGAVRFSRYRYRALTPDAVS